MSRDARRLNGSRGHRGCSMRPRGEPLRHGAPVVAVCSRRWRPQCAKGNERSSTGWSGRRTARRADASGGSCRRFRSLSKGRDPERELRVALESHLPGIQRAFGDPSSQATVPPEAEAWARQLVHDGVSLTAALRSFERGHADAWSTIASDAQGEPLGLSPELRAEEMEYAIRPAVRLRERDHRAGDFGLHRRAGEARTPRRVKPRARGHRPPAGRSRSSRSRSGRSPTAWTRSISDTRCGTPAGADRGELEALASELACGSLRGSTSPCGATSGSLNGWMSCDASALHRGLHDLKPPPGVAAAFGSPRWGLQGFRLTHREALEAKHVAARSTARLSPPTTMSAFWSSPPGTGSWRTRSSRAISARSAQMTRRAGAFARRFASIFRSEAAQRLPPHGYDCTGTPSSSGSRRSRTVAGHPDRSGQPEPASGPRARSSALSLRSRGRIAPAPVSGQAPRSKPRHEDGVHLVGLLLLQPVCGVGNDVRLELRQQVRHAVGRITRPKNQSSAALIISAGLSIGSRPCGLFEVPAVSAVPVESAREAGALVDIDVEAQLLLADDRGAEELWLADEHAERKVPDRARSGLELIHRVAAPAQERAERVLDVAPEQRFCDAQFLDRRARNCLGRGRGASRPVAGALW
jgi:hypothetical protein